MQYKYMLLHVKIMCLALWVSCYSSGGSYVLPRGWLAGGSMRQKAWTPGCPWFVWPFDIALTAPWRAAQTHDMTRGA